MKIEDWVVNLYETNIRKAKEVIEMIDKELK
jgi:hypothetical protein